MCHCLFLISDVRSEKNHNPEITETKETVVLEQIIQNNSSEDQKGALYVCVLNLTAFVFVHGYYLVWLFKIYNQPISCF